jgi:hypothetical protein
LAAAVKAGPQLHGLLKIGVVVGMQPIAFWHDFWLRSHLGSKIAIFAVFGTARTDRIGNRTSGEAPA